VIGKATPVHLGKKTHVWDIKITNENEDLICISRLTVAVIKKK
jgi:1,4-dihydroxy-2-naphthoyl-CoA hydrolase